MLILTRMPSEALMIDVEGAATKQIIVVRVLSVRGSQVRVAIDAAKEVKVLREELWLRDRAWQPRD